MVKLLLGLMYALLAIVDWIGKQVTKLMSRKNKD